MNTKDSSNSIQAMWIAIGNLSSFAFTIISTAILSRFLDKGDYGTYRQVMYVYHTLLAVLTLGLPKAYAYFLPKFELKYGESVVDKLNRLFFLLGGVFALILYVSAPLCSQILNNPDLIDPLRLFAISPVFLLPRMGLEGILSTYRRTFIHAIFIISTRCLMLLFVAMPVALYRPSTEIAIIGFVVSSAITCLLALYLKKIPFKGVLKKQKADLTYKTIFKFSLPLMVAGLGGIVIKAADQFFISRYFGKEVFADFSNGSLELPFVQMVLGAAGVVLLPVFSRYIQENENKDDILGLWRRALVKSMLIIYPLVIYCWFFAPTIMTFFYGNQYETSAIYFRIMLVVNLFTVAQYYPIIVALGKTGYYAKVHVVSAILIWGIEALIIFWIPSPYLITFASVIIHLFKIACMVWCIADTFKISSFTLFPIKDMLKCFSLNIICAGSVWYLFCLFDCENKIFILTASFVVFSVLVMITGKIFRLDYFSVVRPILDKCRKLN